jgi:hypothetical protein
MLAAVKNVHIVAFRVTSGTVRELVELIEEPGSLADILRSADGFCAYDIVDAGDGMTTSISTWMSSSDAEAARPVVAQWMRDHIADGVQMIAMTVGDLVIHLEK